MLNLSTEDNNQRKKRLKSATGVAYPTGYVFFRGAITLMAKIFTKPILYYDERIPQARGYRYKPKYYFRNSTSKIGDCQAFIIAANHGLIWDISFIGMFRRGLVWVCKPHFCVNPILAQINQRMGAVPVFRPSLDSNMDKNSPERIKALQMASYEPTELIPVVVSALKRGVPAIMFPEGSRAANSTVEGAKNGAFRASFMSGCPILPIGLVGCSKEDRVKRTAIMRRRVIVGVVGELIRPESYMHLATKQDRENAMMHDWIQAINELRLEGAIKLKDL